MFKLAISYLRAALYSLCIVIMLASNAYSATWGITYPRAEFEGDTRNEYPVQLIELALEKTGVRYTVSPSKDFLLQTKSIRKLKENIEVNIIWSMTDTQREADLLPIRIPIAKGLIGWRMFVVNRKSAFNKSTIGSFSELLAYSPVQGVDWPDTKILQSNGFNVVTAQDVLEAYSMLDKQQADFFPRSIIEILEELQSLNNDNQLRVKPGLIVEYPSAMYFFVNKRNKTLAKLIETGLTRAIEDGSFDVLFDQHFGEAITFLKVDQALRFKIENPLLPIQTPIFDKHLWYQAKN